MPVLRPRVPLCRIVHGVRFLSDNFFSSGVLDVCYAHCINVIEGCTLCRGTCIDAFSLTPFLQAKQRETAKSPRKYRQ